MEYINYINEFFSHVKCVNCNEFFNNDAIQLVRQESNSIVVRIACVNCGKNLGLAILGIDRAGYKNSLGFSEDTHGNNDMPISVNVNNDPITYDDVVEAHQFFSSLGDDWSKYLPNHETD